MKARPILFSGPMVRALLDGTKTQTRRTVKPQPVAIVPFIGREGLPTHEFGLCLHHERVINTHVRCPYGAPGGLLWVITLKPIAFGAGKYAAGDDGHIYDVSGATPRRRRVSLSPKGYEVLSLRAAGEHRAFRVNRLVAEAFYGPAPVRMSVCRHMDGRKRNNRPENLDWGTDAQNTADANAGGTWSGSANGAAKLTASDIDCIRASTEPQADLAARYEVTQPTISKIKSGLRWRGEHPAAPPPNLSRWASRLTLRLADVRVERLHDISEADAIAEGVFPAAVYGGKAASWLPAEEDRSRFYDTAHDAYMALWAKINGQASVDANPWVWVLDFKGAVHPENVDKVAEAYAAAAGRAA